MFLSLWKARTLAQEIGRLGFYFWSVFKWRFFEITNGYGGFQGKTLYAGDKTPLYVWPEIVREEPFLQPLAPFATLQSLLSAIFQLPFCMTETGFFLLVWTTDPARWPVRELLGSWAGHPMGGGGLGARKEEHRHCAWKRTDRCSRTVCDRGQSRWSRLWQDRTPLLYKAPPFLFSFL